MSDYPRAPPYGASYAGQHQANAPYPPTYPNHTYAQTDSGYQGPPQYAQNYDAAMNAYGYNQHAVPAFGTAPMPPGVPPPGFQGWNQDATSLPNYTTPQNGMAYPNYAGNSYNSAPQYPPEEQQNYPHNNAQYSNLGDEGEVSGGEYDDTYAPANPGLVSYGTAQYQAPGVNGYMSTAQRAGYTKTQNDSPLHSLQTNTDYYPRDATHVARQHPDSFSQFNAAPRPGDQNERPGAGHNYNSYASSNVPEQFLNGASINQSQSTWKQNGPVDSPLPSSHPNRNHATKAHDKSIQHTAVSTASTGAQPALAANPITPPAPAQPTPTKASNEKASKSLAEARKDAQGAILNLYPFQIGFQSFMDEGFDKDIVGRVFDDLGLAKSPTKPANATALQPLPAKPPHIPGGEDSMAQTASKNQVDPHSKLVGMNRVNINSEVKISGKDSTDKPSLASPATTTAPPTKPLAMTEKEQKLQMKMEALRKSREQRAQKAAAKGDAPIPSSVVPVSLPEAKPVREAERTQSKPQQSISSITMAQLPKAALVGTESQVSRPVPAIPGLFLTPSATSPPSTATPPGTMSAPVTSGQRKRPVAADFDTPASKPAPKRPFGQSRYEAPLVINVTDEELSSDDEDVAMELESSVDHNSPILSAGKISDHRNTAMQNMAVLTNLSARKPFTPPPVPSASSTPTGRKSTLGNAEGLQEKEIAIEALRRKIAEAEAAKALKKARKPVNGTSTPRTTDSSSDEAKAMDGDLVKNIKTSIQIQQKISSAEAKVNIDQRRLADAQAAEVEEVAELKKSEADQKRLRREQIATDLPRVDAEVQRNQLRLELLRSEMARLEVTVLQNLEEKQKMADELERLGQEAEDRLQAEKDKLQNLTSAESGSVSDSSGQVQSPTTQVDNTQAPLPVPHQSQASRPTSSELNHTPTLADLQQASHHPLSIVGHFGSPLATVRLESTPVPQSQVMSEIGSIQDARGQDEDNNVESPAPDHSQSGPESVSSPMEVDSRSPSYSPVLERTIAAVSERDDDYEPPDATPPTTFISATGSPPFSPAPPETVTGDVLENSPAALGQATNADVAEETLTEANGQVVPVQREDIPQLTKPTQGFTPYESPLKHFRAFRFHPDFGREVAGGLRSLTYSHKIDPMIEMCPWEMAGGACNDETCEYQHVRDIKLPDDDILKFLGNQDGLTEEQRVQFIDGLKDALGAIRKKNIRDFDAIAQEILAYRRRFLGDDSKVLALEGTTI